MHDLSLVMHDLSLVMHDLSLVIGLSMSPSLSWFPCSFRIRYICLTYS
ncbi:hypothetical protein Huta_1614 [Halorhabdus utahensis DSM 12940]|uniref:Uncharacterized protein n=1 Tax=Halorhabdus utahensis (strain DSM 12940 / JCM 11049 / AX-2) TaxID=519442 RepID=C7NQ44_HALUD|nr:hypothetical protein Huta_1614 [Halorhabdus utahensis DSM 12940]